MAFDQQFSLLSLGGGVENLLLSYVSAGDGGLNAILNLRQVCSTTKLWIDHLPRRTAKQIFAKSQAKVDLDRKRVELKPYNSKARKQAFFEEIQNFLSNPPPLNVNSLKLSGVRELARIFSFSPDEEQLWLSFTAFWWQRLESLEVDYVDKPLRPMNSFVNQLLTAPSLRRLHCDKLEAEEKDPLEFPQSLFYVEHLCIVNLRCFSSIRLTQFFESLAKAPRLKSFKMSIWGTDDVEEIAEFIVLTKDKVNLELIFVQEDSRPLEYIGTRPSTGRRIQLSLNLKPVFVSAVAASSASIRFLQLRGKQLYNLTESVGEETASGFFKTVESIDLCLNSHLGSNDHLRFPNLKRLILKIPNNISFSGIRPVFPKNLPSSLTSLDVFECHNTFTELAESLKNLDKQWPLLKRLRMEWDGDETLEMEMVCVYDRNSILQESQLKTPFPNLKSLMFRLGSTSKERVPANVKGARWILMNGLQLPQLSLLELELDSWVHRTSSLHPVLDSFAMDSLVEGNVAKSLVRFKIDKSMVTKDANLLKEKLESMVKGNSEKLEKRVGSNKKFYSLF